MIEKDLDTNWRPFVNDPADEIFAKCGFDKFPEKLQPTMALLQKSEEWLTLLGYSKVSDAKRFRHRKHTLPQPPNPTPETQTLIPKGRPTLHTGKENQYV